MSQHSPIEPGRILAGRYQLEAVLGRGAVGSVWRARDRSNFSACAIKILHQVVSTDDPAYARFANEAGIIARLFHTNIVELREFGHDLDGTPFLVMEMLNGPTLLEPIRDAARLPLSRVLDITRQVGSALHAAHSVGIVHRDIKPQNIVLHRAPSGSGSSTAVEVVKVVDFGLSRVLGAAGQRTATGMIVGTMEYISPEATLGQRDAIDWRTDQWALAVVVYRLLTGRLPFHSRDLLRLLLKIRNDQPQPLRELLPGLPLHVSVAVDRALAKDKEDRFESIQDFVRALQGLPPRALALGNSSAERSPPAALIPVAKPSAQPIPQPILREPSAPYAEYDAHPIAAPSLVAPPKLAPPKIAPPKIAPPPAASLSPRAPAPSARPALAIAPLTEIWAGLLAMGIFAVGLFVLVLVQSHRQTLPIFDSGIRASDGVEHAGAGLYAPRQLVVSPPRPAEAN